MKSIAATAASYSGMSHGAVPMVPRQTKLGGLTPKQKVQELNLQVGMPVVMSDGVTRKIRRITNNGDVFVRGIRSRANVFTLRRSR